MTVPPLAAAVDPAVNIQATQAVLSFAVVAILPSFPIYLLLGVALGNIVNNEVAERNNQRFVRHGFVDA